MVVNEMLRRRKGRRRPRRFWTPVQGAEHHRHAFDGLDRPGRRRRLIDLSSSPSRRATPGGADGWMASDDGGPLTVAWDWTGWRTALAPTTALRSRRGLHSGGDEATAAHQAGRGVLGAPIIAADRRGHCSCGGGPSTALRAITACQLRARRAARAGRTDSFDVGLLGWGSLFQALDPVLRRPVGERDSDSGPTGPLTSLKPEGNVAARKYSKN